MDYNILTMSVAPRDIHEAQVQFALERGLPAMLGVLSTYRLPFPSRAFDMAHCSRCLVPWTSYGIGLLRPFVTVLSLLQDSPFNVPWNSKAQVLLKIIYYSVR